MTEYQIHAEHRLADMVARYFRRGDEGPLSLVLFPESHRDRVVPPRDFLEEFDVRNLPWGAELPAWRNDPLAHVAVRGEDHGVHSTSGLSMRCRGSTVWSELASHDSSTAADGTTTIRTSHRLKSGLVLDHALTHEPGSPFLRVQTSCRNDADAPVTIDMLTSFSLGGVTPFDRGPAHDRLKLHRFRSYWSAEGRHNADPLERLHLDRSWAGYSVACERFGQIGTMPVRGWFPTALLEDVETGVFWGASLAWSGSWQIEAYRSDDLVNLSGGLADREFGQWSKRIEPGEQFHAPPAVLTCAAGDLETACSRLVESQRAARDLQPSVDQSMPVCFNEWCTSWGSPSHEDAVRYADLLCERGVTYLVIDDGWQAGREGRGGGTQGDWDTDPGAFPQGLKATADAIRERGLIPGIWIEVETLMERARSYDDHAEHLLTLDGCLIEGNYRRFWDLRDPKARELLTQRVIDQLEAWGMGYLKVDYNGTLPFGVDGAESPGEGLRAHVEAVHAFYDELRRRMPELVIENCSSGGHRLEPAMQARTTVGGFSDAHEGTEIPIIAANLHRLILPEQSLVWAVLRSSDDDRRTVYSLAASFLGRICLSGDLPGWSAEQWRRVEEAIAFYDQIKPVLRRGVTRIERPHTGSYRKPQRHQIVDRVSADGSERLIVAHRFEGDSGTLTVPDAEGWTARSTFLDADASVETAGSSITINLPAEWSAAAALLARS